MSIHLFGKQLRMTSASSSVSSTKVSNGFQLSKHMSLSVTGTGTELTGFGPHGSKLGFGSHFRSPKFEPMENALLTKSAFANVFPMNSTGDSKSPGKVRGSAAHTSRSGFFQSGSPEMKQTDGINVFDHTFKSPAPFPPSNCNTSIISNGFNFGIPSTSASHNVLFSFTGSQEKSGCSSQLNLQRRIRRSRRLRKFMYCVLI
jgi:hypothetical protein